MSQSRPREFIAAPLTCFLLEAIFHGRGAAAVGLWAWIVAGALILIALYAIEEAFREFPALTS